MQTEIRTKQLKFLDSARGKQARAGQVQVDRRRFPDGSPSSAALRNPRILCSLCVLVNDRRPVFDLKTPDRRAIRHSGGVDRSGGRSPPAETAAMPGAGKNS